MGKRTVSTDASYIPLSVGQQDPLGGVHEHHSIAPSILNHRASPDLDLERRDDDSASGRSDSGRCIVCRVNLQVGLLALALHLEDNLGIRIGHGETGFFVGTPEESVPKVVPIEFQTDVKVWHVEPYAIDLAEERSCAMFPVHAILVASE